MLAMLWLAWMFWLALMGARMKLILAYMAADEADKNEARRLAWGACGSDARFLLAMKGAAKRGWINSDGITESGRQRLARYPDEPGPTSPPIIVRG